MKNIHVLPTENESRIRYNSFNKVYELCEFPKYHTDIKSTHNIYITSDEDIKYGDWVYNTNINIVLKAKNSGKGGERNWYKIILTTDQDLIKDGVQAIDDEFLEWFVKNPSCEYVGTEIVEFGFDEVPICTYEITIPEKITRCCGRCNGVDDLCYSDMTCDNHKERGCEICYGKKVEYKIIIPKEEPKQETLEEYIEKSYPKDDSRYDFTVTSKIRNGIREGAKWQAERMYSEEEVKKLIELHSDFIDSKIDYEGINNATTAISNPEWNDEEWF